MSYLVNCSIDSDYKLMIDIDSKGNRYNYLFICGNIEVEISAYNARDANKQALILLKKIQKSERI